MNTAHDHYSSQFHDWERRGRGWRVHDTPVSLEPPFVPFKLRPMAETPSMDDGRRPTFLGSLARRLTQRPVMIEALEPEEEPEPEPLIRGGMAEFQALLPDGLDVPREAFDQFLSSLSLCHEPISFEILGTHRKVVALYGAAEGDAPLLRRQLQAHFPEAAFMPVPNALESAWESSTGGEALAVEFGLEREFMLPLDSGKPDPFVGIVGALAELRPGELGLFQVLWQPARDAWREGIVDSVTRPDGRPLFVNLPELAAAAERKVARPLFAAVVRIFICADAFDRVLQLARDLAGSLRAFSSPGGNALIPLQNDGYPFEHHMADVLRRQSQRAGMLLNADELTGFAHLPSGAVRSSAFVRQTGRTRAAPQTVRRDDGLRIGDNGHLGETVPVRLTADQRVRHAHVIGASGTGKSTLLFNLIRQSIEGGEGIAVLDPHGDLIDSILGVIPPGRVDDVVYVNPADAEFPIGFNLLSAHSDLEKTLLASDLVAMFQRLSTSWGDQMNSVLQNAINAFLSSDQKGTIVDLRRFLIEPSFRTEFLKSVRDPNVAYYWQKTFPHLSGGKSVGPILTRLDAFLAQSLILNMVSQPENRLDFADVMDTGKIFLAKLPTGLLGRENSHLLGTLLVSRFQQIAMSRQAQRAESRRLFSIVIDEFADFITPSMAEILSGARKYRIGLTLAHHDLHQLQRSPDVASAVMTHPYTRIVFRVGDDDAEKLADGFSHFEPNDLRNLETGQAVCRVERSDFDFNLSVPLPEPSDAIAEAKRRDEVITASRRRYGTPRADVEAMLAKSRGTPSADESPAQIAPKAKLEKPSTEKPLTPRAAGTVPPPPPAAGSERPLPLAEILKGASPPLPAQPPAVKEAKPLPEQGRGGPEHQAIQRLIRDEAERLGFHRVIEKPVLGGQASIDVWLERGGLAIACEISLTNGEPYEAEKMVRCLRGGVPRFAMVCPDERKLRKIRRIISDEAGPELSDRVEYFTPEAFVECLRGLPPAQNGPEVTVSRGYRVRRSRADASTEAAAIRAIAESMKRGGKK